MEIQIDNKKMWESLWKNMEDSVYRRDIELALKDQGLTVNEQGEIVSIEPESSKVKEDSWYVCIKENTWNNRIIFSEGKLYRMVNDECLLDNYNDGWSFSNNCLNEYFRPATDEEIARYNSALPAPERDNYDEIKQAEIPQDSQRIVSAKAKEALFSGEEKEYLKRELGIKDSDFVITKSKQETFDGELTEFEKTLANICNGWIGYEIGWEDYINENADVLLSLAKKELLGKVNVSKMVADYPHSYDREIGYREVIEDTLNKIKGE